MRQKIFYTSAVALLLSLLFCACNNFSDISMPEKISIKTGAKYGVVLGEKYYGSLGKILGDDLLETLKDSSTEMNVYKYVPNASDDTLQYMLHKNLYEISLDFGEYLDNMNLDDMLSNSTDGIAFSKDITLPEINQTKDISFNIGEITNQINFSMTGNNGATINLSHVIEAGNPTPADFGTFLNATGNTKEITTEFQYAESIQFTSASKLRITVTKKDSATIGPGYTIKLKAEIKPIAGVFAGTSAENINVANGGVIELPLSDGANGRVTSPFTVEFSGEYGGGTAGTEHEYEISFDMSGAKIKTIYNIDPANGTPELDLSAMEQSINQEISLASMSDIIKTAVIGNGSMEIKVANPAGWSNISLDLENFSMGGAGLNLSSSDLGDGSGAGYMMNKILNFASIAESKKTLDFTAPGEKKITVGGTLKVKLNSGATIDLGESGEGASLAGNVKIKIDTIASATADLSSLLKFEMNSTSENKKQLPEEVIKYVSKITFGEKASDKYYKHDKNGTITSVEGKGLGIKCKVLNTLPAGNDIPLQIKSDLFGMDSTDSAKWKDGNGAKIPSGTASAQQVNWVSYPTIDFSGYTTPPYIDISIKALNSNQTLANLALGATYKFGISDVEFVFDWDSAEMKLANAIDPVTGQVDLSDFSMDKLSENMGDVAKTLLDNIEIPSLPVYFFIQKPTNSLSGIIGDVSFQGKIGIDYKDANNVSKRKDIIGTSSSYGNVSFSNPINWPAGDVFTTNLDSASSSAKTDFADILSRNVKSPKLEYNVKLGGGNNCTVYKANMDELQAGEATKIAVDVAIVIPFELKFKQGSSIDILEATDIDISEKKDLLGRESVSSYEKYSEYAPMIKTFRLNYNFDNPILKGSNINIIIDDTHEGEADRADYSGIKKSIPLLVSDPKDGFIEFSSDELESILTSFFMPKILVEAVSEEGVIKVSRSAVEANKSIGFKPEIVIQLDENSPICITDILKK